MAVRLFNDVQQWLLDDGTPNNAGKITFYEPGTTTLKSVYTSNALDTAHTNPVILDANGRPTSPIWLNGEYKYAVTTSGDVAVGLTIDNLNASTASTVETGLIPPNGTFATDISADGQPDDWTIAPLTSATIAIDSTSSAHGKNSLLFTSGGNGGGTATSSRFDVLAGGEIFIEFTYKSSSATSLTKVDIKTYDKDDVVVSTLSGYSEGTDNPTSYETRRVSVIADATAVTAEVVLTGVDSAGTTKAAATTTNFDAVTIGVIGSIQRIQSSGTIATTSGTSHTFAVPSWAKEITFSFFEVSTDGGGTIILQIGTSSALVATGYKGGVGAITSGTSSSAQQTNGWKLGTGSTEAAGSAHHGQVILTLMDSTNHIWSGSGFSYDVLLDDVMYTGGTGDLAAACDIVGITSASTFDAGTISALFKG